VPASTRSLASARAASQFVRAADVSRTRLVNVHRSGYPVAFMRRVHRLAVSGTLVIVAGCSQALPDADSPGARIYQARCGTCHALHHPHALTAAMWEVQIDRMRETMRRRGAVPLSDDEQALVLDYLRAHATDADARAAVAP
jgi:hypothetical protein